MMARIALIHAVTQMEPVHEAFRCIWPEAEYYNILNDSLSLDRERDGVTVAMRQRIGDLADYAAAIGANGILFTCSAFGEAIEAAAGRSPIPVLKPNEAMFEAALAIGGRIAMLATSPPSEFHGMAATGQSRSTFETYCVPGAIAALRAGDCAEHDRLIAQAAPRFADFDAVLLAHFSTARAAPVLTAVLEKPVLTSPGSAVARLKGIIGTLQQQSGQP
jgi:hypothetical protein